MVEHRISYKLYFNKRLKKTRFHCEETYPLYVQINYKRKPIFFKSYYFDLMSQERFVLRAGGHNKYPKLDDVIKFEERAIKHLIESKEDDFSTDLFKEKYDLLTRDVCTILEAPFIDYLYTFLQDKGLPTLAYLTKKSLTHIPANNLIDDLRLSLKSELYNDILQNVDAYGVPYLEIYQFMLTEKKWPFRFIAIWEWRLADTKEKFASFLGLKNVKYNSESIITTIENFLGSEQSGS